MSSPQRFSLDEPPRRFDWRNWLVVGAGAALLAWPKIRKLFRRRKRKR